MLGQIGQFLSSPADNRAYPAALERPAGPAARIHWINRPTFQQAVEIQGRAR
jgi:hypothetical protein